MNPTVRSVVVWASRWQTAVAFIATVLVALMLFSFIELGDARRESFQTQQDRADRSSRRIDLLQSELNLRVEYTEAVARENEQLRAQVRSVGLEPIPPATPRLSRPLIPPAP